MRPFACREGKDEAPLQKSARDLARRGKEKRRVSCAAGRGGDADRHKNVEPVLLARAETKEKTATRSSRRKGGAAGGKEAIFVVEGEGRKKCVSVLIRGEKVEEGSPSSKRQKGSTSTSSQEEKEMLCHGHQKGS